MNPTLTADGKADRFSNLWTILCKSYWVAVKIFFRKLSTPFTLSGRNSGVFQVRVSKELAELSKETKIRIPLWIYPSTEEKINQNFKADNCKSPSEFIENAIKFYLGYLSEEENMNYISPMITETVKAQIKGTEQRLARLLFKVAVELGKLSHMTAAMNDVDEETLKSLHAMCVTEVRKINGIIDYEDAVEYQKE